MRSIAPADGRPPAVPPGQVPPQPPSAYVPPPPGGLGRLRHAIQRGEPGDVWFKTLHALSLYTRCFVVLNAVPRRQEEVTPRIPLDIGMLQPEEVDEYLAFRPDQTRTDIESRLARNHEAFVARHAGYIVGCTWWCTGRCRLGFIHRDIVVPNDVAYAYDSFVLPAHRGQRVEEAITPYRRARTAELGFKWTVWVMWPQNASQRQGLRRRRLFNVVGVIGSWGVGPWQRQFLAYDPALVDVAHPPLALAP